MYFLRNLMKSATALNATQTVSANQIPISPHSMYFEKLRTGIKPRNVAPNNTFLRKPISPKPLKIESKVKASALNGRQINTIKNIP